jgi:hypothetical protein
MFIRPMELSKNLLVSLCPEDPEARAFEKRLDGAEFAKPNGKLLGENDVDHLEGLPRPKVSSSGVELVEQGGGLIPYPPSKGEGPKPMEDSFLDGGVT